MSEPMLMLVHTRTIAEWDRMLDLLRKTSPGNPSLEEAIISAEWFASSSKLSGHTDDPMSAWLLLATLELGACLADFGIDYCYMAERKEDV